MHQVEKKLSSQHRRRSSNAISPGDFGHDRSRRKSLAEIKKAVKFTDMKEPESSGGSLAHSVLYGPNELFHGHEKINETKKIGNVCLILNQNFSS